MEFADVIQQIEEAKANILGNNAKIADLKAKEDMPSEDIVFEMNVDDLPTEPAAEPQKAKPEQPVPEAEEETVEELKFDD